MEEKMTKTKTVTPTYGGFVEFIWPDELSTISCSHSTGAFLSPDSGLSSGSGPQGRKNSMAWERQEDFLELFHNNGVVYDSSGLPAIRGRVQMIFDRGVFIGHFTNFSVEETDDKPWSFELSWEFRVEFTVYTFASIGSLTRSDTQPVNVESPPQVPTPDPEPAPAFAPGENLRFPTDILG